jgi:hypothetical protein
MKTREQIYRRGEGEEAKRPSVLYDGKGWRHVWLGKLIFPIFGVLAERDIIKRR